MDAAHSAALVVSALQTAMYWEQQDTTTIYFTAQSIHYATVLAIPEHTAVARWVEWAVTSPAMVMQIAQSLHLAAEQATVLCALQLALVLCGYMAERHYNRLWHATGWTIHATLWTLIIASARHNTKLVYSMATLFSLFGAVQLAHATQYLQKQEQVEFAYCVLSVLTKSTMAWMVKQSI
jgi:hypothetical protein